MIELEIKVRAGLNCRAGICREFELGVIHTVDLKFEIKSQPEIDCRFEVESGVQLKLIRRQRRSTKKTSWTPSGTSLNAMNSWPYIHRKFDPNSELQTSFLTFVSKSQKDPNT